MSFAQIDTNYKPDFGLGAYYQGINAANAKQLSEEEILKAFLANQKEQNEQPLDLIIKNWQAQHAQDQTNNPEYRKSMLEGYMGQMNSQIAAGRKAQDTVGTEIPAINQENKNKEFLGNLLEQFNKGRLGQTSEQQQPQQSQGNIGFNMQAPQEGPIGNISKQSDMLKSFGTDYKTAPDMPSANYMINEINRGLANPNIKPKDKQDLLKEKQRILTELNGQPPVLSNMVQAPQEAPIVPQGNSLAQIQDVLVNTPEHLQKMEQYKQMGANQANVADIRGNYLLKAAMQRLTKPNEKPLNIDQTAARASRIIAGQEDGDKQAAEIVLQELGVYGLRKNPASYQGTNLNLPATQQTGQIQNAPSAIEQALTGDSTRRNRILKQQGTGTKEDPIKLQ